MESTVFVRRPQCFNLIKILSWNINRVCTKLEKTKVYNLIQRYDIIALNEIKTNLPVNIPGYVTFQGKCVGNSDRGGTAVMVKNCLSNFVYNVDYSIGDQVWFQMSNVEEVLFGFVYIPPSDSPFYSHEAFAAINEKIRSNYMRNGYVVMGDLNARFGRALRDLPSLYELPEFPFSYPTLQDDVNITNDNADFLTSICVDNNLLVLNNLKTPNKYFPSNLTYRRRDTWVSELDTCVTSPGLVQYVSDFDVIKRPDLPSDHAPICITLDAPGHIKITYLLGLRCSGIMLLCMATLQKYPLLESLSNFPLSTSKSF